MPPYQVASDPGTSLYFTKTYLELLPPFLLDLNDTQN